MAEPDRADRAGASDARPHRRFNPLSREWVLVSPQRTARPWQGQVERVPRQTPPAYDPGCYLCPGNPRAGGARNPPYASTFVFDNDFPALVPEPAAARSSTPPLLVVRPERGICRVVCFSPRHDLTLSRMDRAAIRAVVETWIEQYAELAGRTWIRHVQLFENRGEMMGASNPHPHGQIWATESAPDEPARERESFEAFQREHGTCLLCEYAALEASRPGERVVCQNDAFLAVVPFWAVWPFEILVLSRRHLGTMGELDEEERDALADILRRITIRYDNLFEAPFPYSMGFHQGIVGDETAGLWHFHAHFYPPLLRSATIRKFMVGFELLGSPQRDLLPEDAAARLRESSEIHYLEGAAS